MNSGSNYVSDPGHPESEVQALFKIIIWVGETSKDRARRGIDNYPELG